jgi:hypothetical protein
MILFLLREMLSFSFTKILARYASLAYLILPPALLYFALIVNSFAAVEQSDSNKDNLYLMSLGASLTKRYPLITNVIFGDDIASFNKNTAIIDQVFVMPELFFDYFYEATAEVKYQYGFGLNIGYGYGKMDYYLAIGPVRSVFEQLEDAEVRDYQRNSVYYGFGIGYNFTPHLAVKLQGKTYEIDYRDSLGDTHSFRNNHLGLALNFAL